MVKKSKTSSSSQPVAAPLLTVEGSILANTTNSNYLAFISGSAAASRVRDQQSRDSLDPEDPNEPDDPDDPDDPGEPDDPELPEIKSRPNLSDISVISNEVVYDAANNPTAKLVFKIKNSSGEELIGVSVRQEKK
jgi:hypothetical protein